MSKPGSVPGPVRVKPNKKSDLVDYRRAKRIQDYLNSQLKSLFENLGRSKRER